MACIFLYKGKAYTERAFRNFVKNDLLDNEEVVSPELSSTANLDKLIDAEENLDKTILGDRYEEYRRAQRITNNPNSTAKQSDDAQAIIDEIENSLSERDRNRLFGIGEQKGFDLDDLKNHRSLLSKIENAPDAASIADLIKDDFLRSRTQKNDPFVKGTMQAALNRAAELGVEPMDVLKTVVGMVANDIPSREEAEGLIAEILGPVEQGAPVPSETKALEQPIVKEPAVPLNTAEGKEGGFANFENLPRRKFLKGDLIVDSGAKRLEYDEPNGIIISVDLDGDARVETKDGRTFYYNPSKNELRGAENIPNGTKMKAMNIADEMFASKEYAELSGNLSSSNKVALSDLSGASDMDVLSKPIQDFDAAQSLKGDAGRGARKALKEEMGAERYKQLETLTNKFPEIAKRLEGEGLWRIDCP
jgi:hypothetical protein